MSVRVLVVAAALATALSSAPAAGRPEIARVAAKVGTQPGEKKKQRYLAEIMLGRDLYSLGRKDEAKKHLRNAIESCPGRTPLNMQRLWRAREALRELGLQPPPGFPPR